MALNVLATGTPTFCISAMTGACVLLRLSPKMPEHLVAFDLLLGGGHGTIGAQSVVVNRHINLAAIDAAAVIQRL